MRSLTCSVEAVLSLRERPAAVLVCGLNLSDYDGLDLFELVKREGLSRAVVVVCERKDERVLHGLFRYREKTVMVDAESLDAVELSTAVRRARHGQGHAGPSIRKAWASIQQSPTSFSSRLTNAEQAVLAFSAAWNSDEAVALRRGRSAATIQTQRKSAMRKLGLHSQADLVAYAVQAGMIRFEGTRALFPGLEGDLLGEAATRRFNRAVS